MTSENRIQPRLGHRTQRIINIISTAVFFIWIAAQILINIHYLDATQYSDAGIYQRLASECYLADTWYPTATQLTAEPYVFNPGYVNFLILCPRTPRTDYVLPSMEQHNDSGSDNVGNFVRRSHLCIHCRRDSR